MEPKRSPWPLCIIVIPCGNVFLVNMGLDLCFLFLWKQWLSWGGELYPCSPKKYITVKLTGAFSCTHTAILKKMCTLHGDGGSNIPCLCRAGVFLRGIPAEVSKPKKEKESMEVLEKSFLLSLHSQMPNVCVGRQRWDSHGYRAGKVSRRWL